MLAKTGWLLFIAALITVLSWAVYRDMEFEQQYSNDLRNRVVGARLEMDHISPYSFVWKQTDPMRYYDPSNVLQPGSNDQVTDITASPFFHQLLIPIANLPERTISRIWLPVEYLLLAICTCIGLLLATTREQKAIVLVTVAAFLLTEAWKMHIAKGQYYLFIPFLALLFYFFFRKENNLWCAAAAGLCAIMLILIRPNTLIFFLPFLLLIKGYPRRYLAVFFLPVVVLTTWSLASPQERSLWLDYKTFLGKGIKAHQAMENTPAGPTTPFHPGLDYEGWQRKDIQASYARLPYDNHSENGNVFVLFEKIFHRKTNVTILNIACITCIAFLVGLYAWVYRSRATMPGIRSIALFGFCLYMVTDLFSPVWRHQYYTTQWLFPLLLAAATYKPSQKKWFILLALAMALSIFNIPFMKMEHTIGEYLMLGTLLVLSFVSGPPPDALQ